MKKEFKIIENNTVSLHSDDELYHIILSGHHDSWIVVDGGPHFNGNTEHLTAKELMDRFGLKVS